MEQINIFGNDEPINLNRKSLIQAQSPCSVCGSYYRRGDFCNVCRTNLAEPPKKEELKVKREFFQHGKNFSKTKKHRR
jgi:hypothetical protein